MTQDDRRANFLAALERSGIKVNGFESSFIASNQTRFNFGPKQRIAIDRMMAKYGDTIAFEQAKGPSLAAQANAELERIRKEGQQMRRVVVGGKVKLLPARSSAVARATVKAHEKNAH